VALYAQQSDLLSCVTNLQLLQLADDAKTGNISDPGVQAVITGAITEASATVDSYCRTRYAVPLQVSTDATAVARDLAVYGLFTRRPQKMPETVEARYKQALKFLGDISSGKASLDSQSVSPQVSADTGQAPSWCDERFSEHNIRGYV
jgi:phage gp36-like protein